jgi:hypothetical protein
LLWEVDVKMPGLDSPAVRIALLILAVGVLECGVILCLKKPLPLAAIIPCLLPILSVPVVIMPMQRAKKKS